MEFRYKQLNLKAGDVVRVTLDHQANVLLLDAHNFSLYKANKKNFYYHGGWALESPIDLAVPTTGTWYVAIDLAGAAGTLKFSCEVISQG